MNILKGLQRLLHLVSSFWVQPNLLLMIMMLINDLLQKENIKACVSKDFNIGIKLMVVLVEQDLKEN